MRYTPSKELVKILQPAYNPCCGFKGVCKDTATWAPSKGYVPRGFVGALGSIEEVEVVILTAQPSTPHSEEPELYSQAGREDLLDQTCRHTFECFRRKRETYHEGIRYLLDRIFHPDRSLEDQLRKVWITQTYLCSAPGGDSRNVCSPAARECAGRFLAPQLALFENLPIIALGGEAQKRARYVLGVWNLIEAPSPNARGTKAELQRRYRAAAEQTRRMIRWRTDGSRA